MKRVLTDIVKALEETATSIAAMETAPIARGHLIQGEIDPYIPQERALQHQNLAQVRLLIASLPD